MRSISISRVEIEGGEVKKKRRRMRREVKIISRTYLTREEMLRLLELEGRALSSILSDRYFSCECNQSAYTLGVIIEVQ